MSEHVLVGIASILVLGIAAQWLAWRLRLPSILVLLIFGFVAGPISGFLDPDKLIGPVLFPLVSISVAIILFEGGLTLRFAELREIRRAVRNLITIGALITWSVSAVAAYLILGLPIYLAVLLGAILVVTGPTVVIPLLRHVQPVPRVGSVAKWEGIMIDPVGATLAVLVFEAILIGDIQAATSLAVTGFLRTILVGLVVGGLGAAVMVVLLKRYWVPDFLQNPVALMVVVLVFAVSNQLQAESGLLSVTIMGIALANQRFVAVKHIIEFKENLRVLLISGLFILLAARLDIVQLYKLDRYSFLFLGVLVLVARPASVLISTLGSRLNWRERLFLCWMAPRGIVCAAVVSIFSLRLFELGYSQAEEMMAVTFLIIVATVSLYGMTAKTVARWLDLAQENPQGFLILGAHDWGIQLAETLRQQGFQVLVVDTNWRNIRRARMLGLRTHYGNILSEYSLDDLELEGIGHLLALTPNDEANSLACVRFIEVFGRASVYQLVSEADLEEKEQDSVAYLRGRLLFSEDATFANLNRRFRQGAVSKVTKLTATFDFDAFEKTHGHHTLPLFLINDLGEIEVFALDQKPLAQPGCTLISLVNADTD